METGMPVRFTLLKQSSLAPERDSESLDDVDGEHGFGDVNDIDPGLRLMFLANEGELEGIKELLSSGADVNFRDIDYRTALHVAACQGNQDVAKLLIENGAQLDLEDRWGSTPLADAIHYRSYDVIKLLEKSGAKHLGNCLLYFHQKAPAPMHVQNAREVPEYEINPRELDFSNSVKITKGTFRIASWGGTQVAVKPFWVGIADEDKVRAFRDELSLLQKIRHPNVVQFLGAVTQSSPMMIVTEYLPKGDLHEYLKRKGALKPVTALRFAMDIARGMNYLHEHKPESIIHRDLEPSNILMDDSGHLKVADFGVSKLLKVANRVKEDRPLSCQDTSCRYVAPEVFKNEEYDTKVDVFSFALILQEMIEGNRPLYSKEDYEVPVSYAAKERPPFRASAKLYAHGLKELIERCWSENPANRPTFKQIIPRLESIYNRFGHRRRWKARVFYCLPLYTISLPFHVFCAHVRPLKCFQNPDWKKDPSSWSSRSSSSRSMGRN